MNWTNIKLIFLREVRDQLRDRRTLFMVAILPLLLYPAMGLGFYFMSSTLQSQQRTVVIVGADQIPTPDLLDGDRFAGKYIGYNDIASKIRVITDDPKSLDNEELDDNTRTELRQFLAKITQEQVKLKRLADIQEQLRVEDEAGEAKTSLIAEEAKLREEIVAWFSEAPAQVLLIFPEGFRAKYDEMEKQLRNKAFDQLPTEQGPFTIVLHNSANEQSALPYMQVKRALTEWEDVLLDRRLQQASLPKSLPKPVPTTSVDLAEADEIAANAWSKIFPAILVIMAVTGAFYPAIDLGAGEKERGTMETLLISPATRTEIVFGKFLTVMLFSIVTALLNLTTMGFTGKNMVPLLAGPGPSPLGDLAFPPVTSLMWVVLLAVPLAALFSALSLSLAMFAKSSKEGQYYLTPLLMVAMGLTMFCLFPLTEITYFNSVLPVVGPNLLLKALLLGGTSASSALVYVIPVLVTSIMYSALALWWAVEQFQSEGILFRDSERFELRLWLQHIFREKEETPSFMEAGVCFVVIAMLQFYFMTAMQSNANLFGDSTNVILVQLIYLIVTVGVPPAMMAILLTKRPLKSLKLKVPSWSMLGAAVILPLSLQPLALELMSRLDPFFPAIPAGAEEMLKAMSTDAVPLWLTFTTFAIAPAVCEELAFRGFILTGLQRSRHKWLPIVISALLFGGIHMIPKQQFNAALLGLVLGLLAVRSQSLIPGVIFHAIFNGTQVVASRLPETSFETGVARYIITIHEKNGVAQSMTFNPLFLLVCALISGALLYWLIRHGKQPNSNESPTVAAKPLATE